MSRLINARISVFTKSTQHVSSPAIWGGERPKKYDYLVVGAGFAGSVMAERLAVGAGKKVLLIDRRPHIGGNAHDRLDAAGVLIHQYGPHIFHTNSAEIFDYQIVRASCRARVCQYVLISVVAVSLKKKNNKNN